MKRYFLYLSFLLTPHLGETQVWHCKEKNLVSRYSNVPTRSADGICVEIGMEAIAFNKIPIRGTPLKSEKRTQENVPRARLKKPKATWKAQEIVPSKNGRADRFRITCRIRGEARGKSAGPATVRITRGALTENSIPIYLKKNNKPVSWSAELKGRCRKPKVRIIKRSH